MAPQSIRDRARAEAEKVRSATAPSGRGPAGGQGKGRRDSSTGRPLASDVARLSDMVSALTKRLDGASPAAGPAAAQSGGQPVSPDSAPPGDEQRGLEEKRQRLRATIFAAELAGSATAEQLRAELHALDEQRSPTTRMLALRRSADKLTKQRERKQQEIRDIESKVEELSKQKEEAKKRIEEIGQELEDISVRTRSLATAGVETEAPAIKLAKDMGLPEVFLQSPDFAKCRATIEQSLQELRTAAELFTAPSAGSVGAAVPAAPAGDAAQGGHRPGGDVDMPDVDVNLADLIDAAARVRQDLHDAEQAAPLIQEETALAQTQDRIRDCRMRLAEAQTKVEEAAAVSAAKRRKCL